MEGGLINPLALIRTGAAKGVTSIQAACNPKPLNPVDGGVQTRWPRSGIHCYSRCWSAIRP